MKKHAFVFIFVLVSLISFVSCDESRISSVDSSEKLVPGLEEQRMEESLNALGSVGVYDRVFDVPKGFSFDDGGDDGGKALESSECIIDGVRLSYISFVVEFDGFNDPMEKHIDSIPVVEIEFGEDFDSTAYDSTKTYLIIRCYYFEGTIVPAYRVVYIIDGESLVRGDLSKAKETSFSPDFRFDIKNQWDIIGDKPRRYDWISKKDDEADTYRHLLKSENDAFSKLASFGSGYSVLNAWQLYRDDDPVHYSNDEGAYYIVELSSFDRDVLQGFEQSSIGTLRIGSFVNENPNPKSVYARIIQYPNNYRSSYSVMLYWYDSGRWNYTIWIATNEDFDFKYYVEVPLDDVLSVIPGIRNIGTASIAYREYLNGQPLNTLWGSEIDGFYIVEFSQVRESLLDEAKNGQGRDIGRTRFTAAGRMRNDTVAALHIFKEVGAKDYSVCIFAKNSDDSFYSSYTYLPYDEKFNKVGHARNNYALLGDEAKAWFEDQFPTVCNVWQKMDKNGTPVKYNEDGGAFFVISMTEYEPSFDPDFLKRIEYDEFSTAYLDGFEPDSQDLVYVQLSQLPYNYNDGYHMQFCLFDHVKGCWCVSSWQRADHSKRMFHYKELDTIGSDLSGIENIGVLSKVYRKYAENDATDCYVVEFSSVRDDDFLDKVRAAAGEVGREDSTVSRTDAGTVQKGTTAIMYVVKQQNGGFRCCVMMELESGKWYNSYNYIPFDENFEMKK